MVLMLDTLGTRYSMLPSKVLASANTLDLFVMERAMKYHTERSDPNYKKPPPSLTEDQMRAMIQQVKQES